MASEAAESSRAREEAAEREARQQHPWVALALIPLVYGADDAGAEAMAPGIADLMLHSEAPPRASYLVLPDRLAPDARRRDNHGLCIVGSAPARLLVRASHQGEGRDDADIAEYLLCDTITRTGTRLPALPPEFPIKPFPRRTMGLVADPRCPGHHMVVRLHPTPSTCFRRHAALLCYSTATGRWALKPLASAPNHEPWDEHGVFAHDGLLWWVDVAYGLLACDPFDNYPRLRFVPLPAGCEMHGLGDRPRPTARLMDQRRLIRPSQGMLRYVEIQGLSYDRAAVDDAWINPTVSMWTLVDPEGPHPWRFECEASFADIWAHDSYVAAGLPQGKVPKLALVDPNNHDVVYFFQDKVLFALHVRAGRVLACQECLVDCQVQNLEFQYSRFVQAWEWELPPKFPGEDPSSSDGTHIDQLF
ncbi:hypothetical protein PAHAL_5G480100 [Panicum hallii]|jgi:hypothetical protein|uniref:DUF1618 domain-containing protein n=1 Tax=Panicum hallii TaxID=206008 RepID=A0A2T8INT1_9POAL|nr:hypothetical protein PAHAL_5G480100 [Panicum hallii]